MNRHAEKRLHDALRACQWILQFTAGMDFPGYRSSYLVRSAVERQLEILGEALNLARQGFPELENTLPSIRQIVGTRHRLIHGYDSVDDEIVWDVVVNKIPDLIADLERLTGMGESSHRDGSEK